MLYLFELLLFLINTILSNLNPTSFADYDVEVPIKGILTLYSFSKELWNIMEDGLTLADIENILFLIIFLRFLILGVRYNLKTSFYITCIGLFAGYLWYRHLIDLINAYRSVLINLPFLSKLGIDVVELRQFYRQTFLSDSKIVENIHWYNPGKLIYYSFTQGIVNIDPETGIKYYIDPISMLVSNFKESNKLNIIPFYYKLYNQVIPKIFQTCTKFWNQLSGMAAYAIITRLGRKYCPYLIRWHWTFVLVISFIEQIFIFFVYRVYYFTSFILIPQLNENYYNPSLELQKTILNGALTSVVFVHMGFLIFALFHAIWGQYFYVPFFTENTELHIGPRPKNSIYSGGKTAWQDPEEKQKNFNYLFPKFWYGFFGHGTKGTKQINEICGKFFKKIFKKLRKSFRR